MKNPTHIWRSNWHWYNVETNYGVENPCKVSILWRISGNCDLFLCGHCCQRIHSKSKSSKPHQIINLKDFETKDAATSHRQVDLNNMTCAVHDRQECICSNCNKIICFECFRHAFFHQKLSDKQEVYDNTISKMKISNGNRHWSSILPSRELTAAKGSRRDF